MYILCVMEFVICVSVMLNVDMLMMWFLEDGIIVKVFDEWCL